MPGLHEAIRECPPVHDRIAAERGLADLVALARAREALVPLGRLIESSENVRSLLLAVFGASPYLSGLCQRQPETLQDCLLADDSCSVATLSAAMAKEVADAPSLEAAMRVLRRFKDRVALLTALADIGGAWDLERVTGALSMAAEAALHAAVRLLLSRAARAGDIVLPRDDDPEEGSGYILVGMGKLGAHELNYSSDIDLIVFYDADIARLRDELEPSRFFVRLTRDLVRLMQERTSDGYVFRTDLRLRPDPGATQIALSTDAGLTYYESFGQNWERAALIKARVVAGDMAAGEEFLSQLSPFIWRRYLDFAAIADIHAMKRRVHQFKGHAKIAVGGHNIKLGRGGIREIEFFVQTQQLIAGGRQRELRSRSTLETLESLAANRWITTDAAQEMGEAYRFMRHIEHRLQMIGDEQTHTLPERGEELERVAHFAGFSDADAFAKALVERLQTVQSHYEALFEKVPEPPEAAEGLRFSGADEDDPATRKALAAMGYPDPATVAAIVRGWKSGRYAATRSQKARERLNEFLPLLLEALSLTSQPELALKTFDRFLAELPAGVQLFSLLRAKPSLLRLIADIMGTAPRLAGVLSRRPRVLDAVLDPGFFGAVPDPEELRVLIHRECSAATDYQDCLDRARRIGQEQAFLLGVRVLSGTVTADDAGGAYAALAEEIIGALHGQVLRQLERIHGKLAGGQTAVVAMGKLGGREMTAGSDLDLIVIYDFDGEHAQSTGPKPLAGNQYYARFTQRLISAISAPTAEGSLYAVDMRLRPSGNAGPAATRYLGFLDYQQNRAWTWEHLALTRARVVSGSAAFRAKIEETIKEILSAPRDRSKIAADVRDMRARIAKEKGADSTWDLKQARGGLIDIEFVAQYLQIVSAHEHPSVLDQNTGAALRKLSEAGVLSPGDADILIPADRLYQNLTQVLRLCLERPFEASQVPEGPKQLLARAAGLPSFAAVEAHLTETQSAVHRVFDRLIV